MRRWGFLVVGIVLTVGGVSMAVASSPKTVLAKLVVRSPGSGMVLTAVGLGSALPQKVTPQAAQQSQVSVLDLVPTEPTVYLQPARTTGFFSRSEPDLWDVWWDGASQVKTSLSLQQHLNQNDAAAEVDRLATQLNDPGPIFDSATYSFASSLPFAMEYISGAHGWTWAGTETDTAGSVPISVTIALFSRGTVAALALMTAYGGARVAPSAFRRFVTAQYAALGASVPSRTAAVAGGLILLGLVLTIIGIIEAVRERRRTPALAMPFVAMPGYWPPAAPHGYGPPAGWSGLPPVEREGNPRQPTAEITGATPSVPDATGEHLPQAGWYRDPSDPARVRFWTGSDWSPETAPGPGTPH